MLAKNRLKAFSRLYLLPFACVSVIALASGCNSNSTNASDREANQNTDSQSNDIELAVVSDFAARVVIPTYELLVEKADELNKAVETFVNEPNDANLKAAQQAWIETRYPWEKSEAFPAFLTPKAIALC